MSADPVAEVSRISPQLRWAIAEHNVEIIRARRAYAEARAKETQMEIQPTAAGELVDGVRAHYRTVHPERGIR